MDIREKLLEILNENGIYIDKNKTTDDIDLREYIIDSMQFISFIVEIENKLNIEIPDECLIYDNISSLNGFSNIISCIVSGDYVCQSGLQLEDDCDPLEDDDFDEDDPYAENNEDVLL